MADQLAHGNLADIILRLRNAGLSWRIIERRLHDEYRVDVTPTTLAAWHAELVPSSQQREATGTPQEAGTSD